MEYPILYLKFAALRLWWDLTHYFYYEPLRFGGIIGLIESINRVVAVVLWILVPYFIISVMIKAASRYQKEKANRVRVSD